MTLISVDLNPTKNFVVGTQDANPVGQSPESIGIRCGALAYAYILCVINSHWHTGFED
jgi:hypothetical protein